MKETSLCQAYETAAEEPPYNWNIPVFVECPEKAIADRWVDLGNEDWDQSEIWRSENWRITRADEHPYLIDIKDIKELRAVVDIIEEDAEAYELFCYALCKGKNHSAKKFQRCYQGWFDDHTAFGESYLKGLVEIPEGLESCFDYEKAVGLMENEGAIAVHKARIGGIYIFNRNKLIEP